MKRTQIAGVYKLEIQESVEGPNIPSDSRKLLNVKEWVHLLYLLKTAQAKTVKEAARILKLIS